MKLEKKEVIFKALIGLCIGIVIIGFFYFGAVFSCSRGNGKLLNWACVNIENKGICQFGNTLYEVSEDTKIGLYKELDELGNLSQEIYIKNESGGLNVIR